MIKKKFFSGMKFIKTILSPNFLWLVMKMSCYPIPCGYIKNDRKKGGFGSLVLALHILVNSILQIHFKAWVSLAFCWWDLFFFLYYLKDPGRIRNPHLRQRGRKKRSWLMDNTTGCYFPPLKSSASLHI